MADWSHGRLSDNVVDRTGPWDSFTGQLRQSAMPDFRRLAHFLQMRNPYLPQPSMLDLTMRNALGLGNTPFDRSQVEHPQAGPSLPSVAPVGASEMLQNALMRYLREGR